jgi:hypothetical protein
MIVSMLTDEKIGLSLKIGLNNFLPRYTLKIPRVLRCLKYSHYIRLVSSIHLYLEVKNIPYISKNISSIPYPIGVVFRATFSKQHHSL